MLTLQNITNAFVKVSHDGRTLLADPWVSEGIFDGGWSPFPPIQDPQGALATCDYLYISHIHEDHFDLQALKQLPRSCKVVVLDMFPNHIIQKCLAKLGFRDVTMLPPFTPLDVDDLTIEVIPPMNMFAQELEYYQKGRETVAVDASAAVTWGGLKILLLNDNSPYDQSLLKPHLSRLQHCDLLALNYNGAADDYPVCYRGISEADKIRLSDQRDRKKFDASCKLIDLLKPKAVMPYSSEFSVRGRQARAFARIKASFYNDKQKMADALAQASGVQTVYAYESDRLKIDREGIQKVAGESINVTLAERAEALFWDRPNYADRFPKVPSVEQIDALADRASEHMFHFMERLNLNSEWVLKVYFADAAEPIVVDLHNRRRVKHCPADRKTLSCFTDTRYLGALFERHAHWNNATISYNLEWQRRPNEYDPFLYDSLNFFHV